MPEYSAVETIGRHLMPVFEQYQIRHAVLFGSFAKGTATEKSDVDLLVESGLRGLR
ncbi:MAG: nucleotidyltransferase domain-containing protein, partial [Clostridia bacterium]|nr:nucleotidyltransferase domain-containing protein [Clostridia bacterium]